VTDAPLASRSSPAPMVDVAVVGGGIAGLATAYELQKRGLSFVVLERSSRPGGVILSEEFDGYTIDAGPDALLVQKPAAIKLCQELGLGDRLVPTKPPRLAYVQRQGRLHPLPADSVLGIPTRIAPFIQSSLFTWTGKLRMGAELFVPRRREPVDESIGSFMRRRFGNEAVDYLAEPLLAGIHAGDVDRLSVSALFPRLAEAERQHGSLLRAFRAERRRRLASSAAQRGSGPERASASSERASASAARAPGLAERTSASAFRSLPGGLSEMVRALVAAFPAASIRMNTPVLRLTAAGPAFRIETSNEPIVSRALVLATPTYASSALVRELDADLARACCQVPYASIATLAFAFPRAAVSHPLNGSGFVVPRKEASGILAGTWLSSKWPHRAPADRVLIRTFVGGARDPRALERSDAELIATSLAALRPLVGISGEPLFVRVYRFDRANAQHEVGHLARVAEIEADASRVPGLFMTGSGLRGVGIPDCVADGRATAQRVADWLAR